MGHYICYYIINHPSKFNIDWIDGHKVIVIFVIYRATEPEIEHRAARSDCILYKDIFIYLYKIQSDRAAWCSISGSVAR